LLSRIQEEGNMRGLVEKAGVGLTLFLFCAGCVMGWQAPAQSSTVKAPASSSAVTPDHAGSYYHFMLARRYEELAGIYNRSDYIEHAISEYQQAIADDPDSLFLRVQLGQLYWRVDRIGDALSEAQYVLKANPNDLDAHRLLGDIYLHSLRENQTQAKQRQSLEKAIHEYEAIIRLAPNDIRSAVLLGRLYGLDNHPEKAEAIFKKILNDHPDSTSALSYLGKLYIDQEQYQQAIQLFQRIPENQRGPSTLAMLGLAYSQTGDYAQAVKNFKAALEADPENVDVRRQYADALMRSGKMDGAHNQFEQILKVNPQDGVAYLRLAQIDQSEGHYDVASKELDQAQKLLPGDLEVTYQQALLQNSLGRQDQAIKILQDLLSQTKSASGQYSSGEASNRAAFLERLGMIYRSQGKYDEAINTFRQITGLGKDQASQGEGLIVETLQLEGQPQKAMQEAEEALKKYPNNRSLILLHASLLGDQGHVNEAVQELRNLMKDHQDDTQVQLAIVQVYSQAKRYREAQNELDQVLAQPNLKPSDREFAEFLLGSVYERQKKYDLAEQQFKKVLQVDPLNSAAFNYLGYMLADRGIQLEQSVQYIKKALQLEPNNGAYLDSLGWAYYKMARYDLALAPLQKAATLLSNDPTVLEHLGHLYLKLGKEKEAAEEWELALKKWPNSSNGDFDAAQAAKLQKRLSQLEHRLAKDNSKNN
jgi:tetratricopeptide (TPR) repeat protein